MENPVVTTVRLEQKLLKELDLLALEEETDRTTILRQALHAGLRELKINSSLTLYQKGKVSLGKAKELAGVSLWELLDLLKERKIGIRTDETEFQNQLSQFEKRS
ncbi:UPF0175 family protein [Candidatus Micrarchaeota archaeon]|nr:UPF0175 family protein [Candidatus Micrarchaeota archaeon]